MQRKIINGDARSDEVTGAIFHLLKAKKLRKRTTLAGDEELPLVAKVVLERFCGFLVCSGEMGRRQNNLVCELCSGTKLLSYSIPLTCNCETRSGTCNPLEARMKMREIEVS